MLCFECTHRTPTSSSGEKVNKIDFDEHAEQVSHELQTSIANAHAASVATKGFATPLHVLLDRRMSIFFFQKVRH